MKKFEDLLGKTLISISGAVGEDEVNFVLENGDTYQLYHEQDCCEDVWIEDICGDLSDLVGHPILLAEESVNDPHDEISSSADKYMSHTWTFYRMSTIKGSVTIRWHGESNGYYSERVDFKKVKNIKKRTGKYRQ